jgi:hypothetical protein
LWSAMTKSQRVGFVAGGGPMQGNFWAWPRNRADNDVFRIALLRRAQLGCIDYGEFLSCQHPYADKGKHAGELCDQALKPGHDLQCKAGAARIRTHTLVKQAIAQVVKANGGAAELEKVVPYLSKMSLDENGCWQVEAAVLDVVVYGAFPCRMLPVDVTIRDPLAARYSSVANAGTKAVKEKQFTYGPDVLTLALTPQGRFLPAAQEAIRAIAAAVQPCSGRSSAAIVRQLVHAIEFAQLTGTATTSLQCLGSHATTTSPPPSGPAAASRLHQQSALRSFVATQLQQQQPQQSQQQLPPYAPAAPLPLPPLLPLPLQALP